MSSGSEADPEEREQELKRSALENIGDKRRRRDPMANSEFDRMYGKEGDDFLNDSDWDVDSFVAPSARSYKSSKTLASGKVKGLENIYLQRLEGAKKRKAKREKMKAGKQAKFRPMQHQFLPDTEMLRDSDEGSEQSYMSKKVGNGLASHRSVSRRSGSIHDRGPNIFSGNRGKYVKPGEREGSEPWL